MPELWNSPWFEFDIYIGGIQYEAHQFIEGLDIKAGLFELALEVHLCLGTPRGQDQRVEEPGTQDLTTGLVI